MLAEEQKPNAEQRMERAVAHVLGLGQGGADVARVLSQWQAATAGSAPVRGGRLGPSDVVPDQDSASGNLSYVNANGGWGGGGAGRAVW